VIIGLRKKKMMNEFKKYLKYWNLISDGEPIITNYSKLLPVRYNNRLAMLKIALSSEECTGGELMIWWNGQGAAQILAHKDSAFLMERSILSAAWHIEDGSNPELAIAVGNIALSVSGK
jgi:streptomycin 6-kinase